MDVPVESLIHWIPTPLLALGFWGLMKKAFTDHEVRFADLLKRFEDAMEKQQEHNLALALFKQIQDAQQTEINRLRDQHHRLATGLTELQSQIIARLTDEGSGPRFIPRMSSRDE